MEQQWINPRISKRIRLERDLRGKWMYVWMIKERLGERIGVGHGTSKFGIERSNTRPCETRWI